MIYVRLAEDALCSLCCCSSSLSRSWLDVEIGEKECNVDDYDAKGDGKTRDTNAIQKALDDCGKSRGRVSIGKSNEKQKYLTSALTICTPTQS